MKSVPAKLTTEQRIAVIHWLSKEKPVEWIQERLSLTRQQVAAVKAHITMGTYKN